MDLDTPLALGTVMWNLATHIHLLLEPLYMLYTFQYSDALVRCLIAIARMVLQRHLQELEIKSVNDDDQRLHEVIVLGFVAEEHFHSHTLQLHAHAPR